MNRQSLNIACQTFTWEMLGDLYQGGPDDLLEAVANAGYSGIEITDTMIGHYAHNPAGFETALNNHNLVLTAMAFGSASGFSEPSRITEDLETTNRWIEFAGRFPGALVSIGSATQMSAGSRNDKIKVAADFYNQAAALGHTAGVAVAVHPSSHENTLLFDRADYELLFSSLDPQLVGWVPDTGHILRGGQDLSDTLKTWLPRIRYIHLKDVNTQGQWSMLGEGICNVKEVIDIARTAPNFTHWLVVEEESLTAAENPEQAIKINYDTLRRYGL